jgi:hypothetical protein
VATKNGMKLLKITIEDGDKVGIYGISREDWVHLNA